MASANERPEAIGITGHQDLTPRTAALVAVAVDAVLAGRAVVGVTSLAAGADQVFAECVLRSGGTLVVVVPAKQYRDTFAVERDAATFDHLLERATTVIQLPFGVPSEAAYWAAGQEIVRRCDRLVAVWDGEGGAGRGGTADVVRYARAHGRDVVVVWPPGARRARKAVP